jgi:hypothetical protein
MRRPVVAISWSKKLTAGGIVQVSAQLLLVELVITGNTVILQAVHLNAQPNVNHILLKESSTSMKHIEGSISGVGMIAIKGQYRQQVIDSGCAYRRKD